MRLKLDAALASALTILIGVVTVVGLLISEDLGLSAGFVDLMRDITSVFLRLITITIALTILIGVANLLYVHFRKITGRKKGAPYSIVLIASFLLAVGLYIVDPDESMTLLETVQISVESALAGLLFFALVYGAYRMMRERVTGMGILFISVLLIVLVGALPFNGVEIVSDIRDWVLEIPVSAGARGILVGIALATVVTGVRVLIGVDRSYRE
jgi:hypothetical protein